MDDVAELKRKRDDEIDASSNQTSVSSLAPSKPAAFAGPRKKAVARPEDPAGVEDICYADITTTVPTEMFKIKDLQFILNMKTWDECLSNGEREYLMQFLPDVDNVQEVLSQLLDGHTNFCFGNPMARIWELMKQGECHPRVAKYREALRCLHHCQHFHSVRDYHNNMVLTLRQMAFDNDQEPLDTRVQRWNTMLRDRSLHVGKHDLNGCACQILFSQGISGRETRKTKRKGQLHLLQGNQES